MDWISEGGPPDWKAFEENGVPFAVNETPVGQPTTDFIGIMPLQLETEPTAAEIALRVRQQQAMILMAPPPHYDGVKIYNELHPHTPKTERVVLPDDLFPPPPDIGYMAIILAVRSKLIEVLSWWHNLR